MHQLLCQIQWQIKIKRSAVSDATDMRHVVMFGGQDATGIWAVGNLAPSVTSTPSCAEPSHYCFECASATRVFACPPEPTLSVWRLASRRSWKIKVPCRFNLMTRYSVFSRLTLNSCYCCFVCHERQRQQVVNQVKPKQLPLR